MTMGYLLYCIFQSQNSRIPEHLTGLENRPVSAISCNGFSAAVSCFAGSKPPLDIKNILIYKNVVDAFFQDRTVIPMRYGCLLEDEKKAVQLLKINQAQYEALLRELDGCVEMGIRVLIVDCRLKIEDLRNSELENSNPQSAIERSEIPGPDPDIIGDRTRAGQNPKSKITGRAYLTARKTHYGREDNLSKEMDAIIDRYRETFSGLYVKFKAEYASTGNLQFSIINRQSPIANPQSPIANPMLSLYFLVRRKSVESFRQAFRQVVFKDHAKLLLSGPWPPFNFVQPDRAPGLNIEY